MKSKYDIVILGGGLAGLTLARQIKLADASVSILVLEKRKDKARIAAHKVGESTVELGTFYLRNVLDLADYLDAKHLPKHGLRFFFSSQGSQPIENRVEYGAKKKLYAPSHQIDRGLFENDLTKMNIDIGIDVVLNANVKDVLFGENQTTTYKTSGITNTVTSDWVVDATGRFHFLKRKLKLTKPVAHNINSVWFRIKGKVDVSDWSTDEEWKSYIKPGGRRLGTVHLMGKGYWVWIIPLSTDYTSIGIVADAAIHNFDTINSLDKAFEWLKCNEPLCYTQLEKRKEDVIDFRPLMNFSYHSTKFYSHEKWGVVGESGGFLDPFYSPGTDFIAMSNDWMSDLILRDLKGEDIHTRTIIYDQVQSKLIDNWLPIYKDKYKLFGNPQIMVAKITWDFAVYWSIPSLIFTNKGYTNMKVLRKIFTTKNSFGERFALLSAKAQDFFLEWGAQASNEMQKTYFDPLNIPFLVDFQKGLEYIHASESELITQLEANLKVLELMLSEMYRVVYARLNSDVAKSSVNPYAISLSNKELDCKIECICEPDEVMKEAIEPIWIAAKR